jgi:hypothetical protein
MTMPDIDFDALIADPIARERMAREVDELVELLAEIQRATDGPLATARGRVMAAAAFDHLDLDETAATLELVSAWLATPSLEHQAAIERALAAAEARRLESVVRAELDEIFDQPVPSPL